VTARPHLSEEQRQQRELNARRDLEQLVEHLVGAASDIWHDQRLWGHGDRARYYGRSADLITAVDKLSKMILEHPDADVRADRLIALHDGLEAAAIIGGCLKTPAANRLRTANTRAVKAANVDQRDEIIREAAEPIWQRHPTRPDWRIAGEIPESVKELLKQLGLKTQRGIAGRVKQLRRRPND
jgi:hypothetical protein